MSPGQDKLPMAQQALQVLERSMNKPLAARKLLDLPLELENSMGHFQQIVGLQAPRWVPCSLLSRLLSCWMGGNLVAPQQLSLDVSSGESRSYPCLAMLLGSQKTHQFAAVDDCNFLGSCRSCWSTSIDFERILGLIQSAPFESQSAVQY